MEHGESATKLIRALPARLNAVVIASMCVAWLNGVNSSLVLRRGALAPVIDAVEPLAGPI